MTIVGGITPVWFSWYQENTKNFQSLYLSFKWSMIYDILSHYYDTLVTGILVEIHKLKKELSDLVAKKSANSGFVPDRIEKSISGTMMAERNCVTDSVLLIIWLHLSDIFLSLHDCF